MPAYQELIHADDNKIKYPRINRLLNRLVKKCRQTKAADNCIGCLGYHRCIKNGINDKVEITYANEPEQTEQARIEV